MDESLVLHCGSASLWEDPKFLHILPEGLAKLALEPSKPQGGDSLHPTPVAAAGMKVQETYSVENNSSLIPFCLKGYFLAWHGGVHL